MVKAKKQRPVGGQLRQSQVLSTFGPGSMVDLPNQSVLIGGLNHWEGYKEQLIYEERLQKVLCTKLELNQVKLYAPPVDSSDPLASPTGISAFIFPTWFVAQVKDSVFISGDNGKSYQTRPLVPYKRLIKGQYLTDDKKKVPVVPVRFVQACLNGHISDIDWYAFVKNVCNCRFNTQLWLDESELSNDFTDIFIRCGSCNERRPFSDATIPGSAPLGYCKGERPWLGSNASEVCCNPDNGNPERNRLLVRSASNAYFPQILSVISLPEADADLKDAVSVVYEEFLQYAESQEDIKRERRKERVANALEGFSDQTIWEEVQKRQNPPEEASKTIKQVEIESLLSTDESLGSDVPQGDFYARTKPISELPPFLENKLERIVLVHRLKEVMALVGFTRFEAALQDIDGELSIGVRRAALDLESTWFPAIENRGEGIFLSFNKEAIKDWQLKEPVKEQGNKLYQGFVKWRREKGIKEDKIKFPGLPYIMLHSLSHLLITAVSLDCGYAASSIRERIYAGESGYGILLFTGTTGNEGTLGGLIEAGAKIEQYLSSALELGRLCSNDPVCAEHSPENQQENRPLHGSACHGCLLIAETSCERRNELLDRSLVVNTVANLNTAFFLDS